MGFANLAGNIAIFLTPSEVPIFGTNINLFFSIGMLVVASCCAATLMSGEETQYVPSIADSGVEESKSLFRYIFIMYNHSTGIYK
jgi:hypothetical protein